MKKEPLACIDDYCRFPDEYVAESFDRYYHDAKSRKELKKNNPGITEIFDDVETMAVIDRAFGISGKGVVWKVVRAVP